MRFLLFEILCLPDSKTLKQKEVVIFGSENKQELINFINKYYNYNDRNNILLKESLIYRFRNSLESHLTTAEELELNVLDPNLVLLFQHRMSDSSKYLSVKIRECFKLETFKDLLLEDSIDKI